MRIILCQITIWCLAINIVGLAVMASVLIYLNRDIPKKILKNLKEVLYEILHTR